jgi:AraC-like DNA-binding protein
MITETDFSIQYISLAVGYSDIFIFSKAFKKAYGMAPSMYREKNNVNTTAL